MQCFHFPLVTDVDVDAESVFDGDEQRDFAINNEVSNKNADDYNKRNNVNS